MKSSVQHSFVRSIPNSLNRHIEVISFCGVTLLLGFLGTWAVSHSEEEKSFSIYFFRPKRLN
jgi:hypothetical protein